MKILFFLLFPLCLLAQLSAIDNKLIFLKGDTDITTSNGGVDFWGDQSGSSNDFVQTADIQKPDWTSNSYLDFVSANNNNMLHVDANQFTFGGSGTDTPFSIVAYVNMDDADNFIIFAKADAFPQLEYVFSVLSPSHNLRLNLFDDNTTAYRRKVGATDLSTLEGGWISLGCTYDGTTIKLYLNGNEETGTQTEASYTAMSNTTAVVYIGRFVAGASYANGKFKYFLVTTDVLTPTEMINLQTYFATGTYPSETQNKGLNHLNHINHIGN